MIRLENINKVFEENTINENHALKNINLQIKERDFITIIGSNGAGKSTLFNIISGTHTTSSGKIYIDNYDITNMQEFRRSRFIGRIFQNPLLGTAGTMTIEENMVIACKKGMRSLKLSLNSKLREEFKKQLQLLDMNLENRLKHEVGLLSGGQRQALTLLMMVMTKPRLILLDEHTAALDPKNEEKVINTNIYSRVWFNSVYGTHDMQSAIKYGNRLLMMDGGK